MRDDRYKRAPVPRCWRKFTKALYQVADRLQPGRLSALFCEVLATDVRRQLGDGLFAQIAGQNPILPGVGLSLGRAPTALAVDINARICALSSERAVDPQASRQEAELAIREYAIRWGRELNTHLSAERAPDGRDIMRAYHGALAEACSNAVSGLLAGARSIPADVSVDLEENLLPPPRDAR